MCEEYSQYPRVISYLADTWLKPYKERFITAWTDTCMHLGSNSSQRYSDFITLRVTFSALYCTTLVKLSYFKQSVLFYYRAESAHARLKKYLGGTTMSSLQTSFDVIEKMLVNQFGKIKKSFEKSVNIPRHIHLRDAIFDEIRCRISLYAMELIGLQLESAADAYPLPSGSCGCSIKTSHGLPCMHDLRDFIAMGIPIPLSSIHVHWSRLSMHADGFNAEGEQPDETSRVVDILQGMDPCMRKHMIDRFVDMADPSQSSVRGPNVQH